MERKGKNVMRRRDNSVMKERERKGVASRNSQGVGNRGKRSERERNEKNGKECDNNKREKIVYKYEKGKEWLASRGQGRRKQKEGVSEGTKWEG